MIEKEVVHTSAADGDPLRENTVMIFKRTFDVVSPNEDFSSGEEEPFFSFHERPLVFAFGNPRCHAAGQFDRKAGMGENIIGKGFKTWMGKMFFAHVKDEVAGTSDSVQKSSIQA